MSKNSTSRTGSGGDADTNNCKEAFTNAYSGSSTYRSKKELEGGPYGDSPPDQQRQAHQDYFILMLQDNEDTATSDFEEDHELYDLRNDYLRKLNIVRRRLNLTDINDGDSNCSSSYRGKCKITEIIEEERSKEVLLEADKSERSPTSEDLEIQTIHPFSLCYNTESKSATDILELEYNPPKKKSCYRLKTPRVPSSIQSNIPYHEKISQHEPLFKNNEVENKEIAVSPKTWKEAISKFTVSKETQCSEEQLGTSRRYNSHKLISQNCTRFVDNINLFPEVIVNEGLVPSASTNKVEKAIQPESKTCQQASGESDRENNSICCNTLQNPRLEKSYATFKAIDEHRNEKRPVISSDFLVNSVEAFSEGSYYNTVTSSTTTILDNSRKPSKKRRFWNKKRFQKQTLWEEVREIQAAKRLDGGAEGENTLFRKSFNKLKRNQYQKVGRVKSAPEPSTKKEPVPFGSFMFPDFERAQQFNNKFYYLSSSSDWHSSRFESSHSSEEKQVTIWQQLFCCFRPLLAFFERKK